MRTFAITAVAAGALAGAALASSAQAPHLKLADTTPLTVAGTGFKSHEHVKVAYTGDQVSVRHVVATTAGTFSARFAGISFQACKFHRLTAIGSLGSKAVFRMPPVPCQPPTGSP